MHQKFIHILIFLFCLGVSAQTKSTKHKFGVTFGITNFISDTEAFTTEPATGLSFGLAGNFVLDKRSEITLELKYNRHKLKFRGRPALNAQLEDVDLILKQLEVPLTYTYNIVSTNNFKLGLNAGAAANLFYEYSADNKSQGQYLLDPNNIQVEQLYFDTEDENVGFNVFLIAGLSFKFYRRFLITPKYYHGLLNPYRQAAESNPLSDYETQVSYYFFGLTYYL